MARPPVERIVSAVAAQPLASRSRQRTCAPRAASMVAVAHPIPDAAPVTHAAWLVGRIMRPPLSLSWARGCLATPNNKWRGELTLSPPPQPTLHGQTDGSPHRVDDLRVVRDVRDAPRRVVAVRHRDVAHVHRHRVLQSLVGRGAE